jgi:hypothetical protein
LHEEVGVQADVEVQVVAGGFRLLDVEGEALVEETNSLVLVAALAPLNHSLKEGMLSSLTLRLTNLSQEF